MNILQAIFSILIIFLSASQCNSQNNDDIINTIADIKWTHAHEEDRGDVRVYYSEPHEFPPFRGRTGFQFQKEGKLVQYNIAPGDGLETVMGEWESQGDKIFLIKFGDGNPSYQIEIIEYDKQYLKVRIIHDK